MRQRALLIALILLAILAVLLLIGQFTARG
jgi:hypothetical protein